MISNDFSSILEQMDAIGFGSFQILSWLIFLFGVMNLINTTLSNQMARKQENSILRSIGLTQKQLYQMIVCEGLCYALTAVITTVVIGLPVSVLVCRVVSSMTYGVPHSGTDFMFEVMAVPGLFRQFINRL